MAWRRFFGVIDNEVRDDMFRAFAGNEAAMRNALSAIDAKLQEDPNHAQALVWRGAARSFQAGQSFRAGDIARGRELAASGMSDMDRALTIEPKSIGVLIPRASTLLAAARNQPDPARARELAARAAADFETAFAIRQGVFDKLGQHNRGEYLSGLAESWALAGDKASAERYLQRIRQRASEHALCGPGCRQARQLERPRSAQLPELSLAMRTCPGCGAARSSCEAVRR